MKKKIEKVEAPKGLRALNDAIRRNIRKGEHYSTFTDKGNTLIAEFVPVDPHEDRRSVTLACGKPLLSELQCPACGSSDFGVSEVGKFCYDWGVWDGSLEYADPKNGNCGVSHPHLEEIESLECSCTTCRTRWTLPGVKLTDFADVDKSRVHREEHPGE